MDIIYASAQSGATGGSGGMLSILPFILIMLILYFLMIRPQSKRQKEKKIMIGALKKGDRVVTIGGRRSPHRPYGKAPGQAHLAQGR